MVDMTALALISAMGMRGLPQDNERKSGSPGRGKFPGHHLQTVAHSALF